MNRRRLAIGLLLCSALVGFQAARADYDATSARGADLSGTWLLNEALSEDPEKKLEERLEEERRRYERQRRDEDRSRPPGAPPRIDIDAPPPDRPGRRPWQKQRDENFRKMLGLTKMLVIRQRGASVEITSAVEARRLTAGSRTQVSMPEGHVADSTVGWDGEWFVIERKVRGGPRVIEKFRLLRTGQLEYTMAWSGDTELARIKARRVFDRAPEQAVGANPELGPIR
ncbi:MAG: hypothetical protein ACREV5_01550 [Steroidobacter sp.]